MNECTYLLTYLNDSCTYLHGMYLFTYIPTYWMDEGRERGGKGSIHDTYLVPRYLPTYLQGDEEGGASKERDEGRIESTERVQSTAHMLVPAARQKVQTNKDMDKKGERMGGWWMVHRGGGGEGGERSGCSVQCSAVQCTVCLKMQRAGCGKA